MNAPFKQAERLGRLTTALGQDELVLLRLSGSDHLNDLFEYRVEALSPRNDIDFDALIGTHATVEIATLQGQRPFDGIVTQARWAGAGENGHRYDLILRPWFWVAGRRRNQRIFHEQTVAQILTELLTPYAGLGDPAVEMRLTRDYPVLEYTVQYRESDLDFARRQMERHGISFYFRHDAGSHTLVITDDVSAHESVGARPFKGYDGHHQPDGEHFWEWSPERNLTTGAIRLTDYNFKTPTAAMEVDRLGDASYAQGQIESFDWPGDFLNQDRGKTVAGLRIAQERGADQRSRAAGDCVSLGGGALVDLSGDPVPGTGEQYVCLTAHHNFESEAFGSGGAAGDGYSFTGSYVLMPAAAPMAPPRRTPSPSTQGPQTATVVGDGEIDCDDYGRILVRFHWDIAGANSMRVRVAQNWAGGGWGGVIIPRIGMEVVVEFLEGDPDKPLVTGCVFNGKNDTPYPLPASKTKAVWRSQTHQGSGYNEISFEDQAGQEVVFMHAQKDHNTVIENDESHSIGHDRTKTVANNQTESVGNDKAISVGNNHTETITTNKTMSVGGNHSESITGDMSVNVTGNQSVSVSSARNLTVTGDASTLVSKGNHSLTVQTGNQDTTVSTGNQSTTVSSGNRFVDVAAGTQSTTVQGDITTRSKGGVVAIKAAKAIILEAPSILLKADGSNYVLVNKGQVVVEGGETFINPREAAPET